MKTLIRDDEPPRGAGSSARLTIRPVPGPPPPAEHEVPGTWSSSTPPPAEFAEEMAIRRMPATPVEPSREPVPEHDPATGAVKGCLECGLSRRLVCSRHLREQLMRTVAGAGARGPGSRFRWTEDAEQPTTTRIS